MMLRIAALLFVLCFAAPASAREVAGVDLAEELTQTDGTVLQLNGAGIRSKFFFKIYVAALYLQNRSTDAASVIGDNGGKRMIMHFLYDKVDKDDLIEAWNAGFSGNGTKDQLTELSDKITAFNDMFDTVKSGDRIILDYIPGSGTQVTIRNEPKGLVEGKAFNDLLLSIWLGKEPVGEDLRDELLGR